MYFYRLGFETSSARDLLVRSLQDCGFNHFKEFLLCPTQFGMPNSRLRYYLTARKDPAKSPLEGNIEQRLTMCPEDIEVKEPSPVGEFLDEGRGGESSLPRSVILKHAEVIDIVNVGSRRSCCFTKSYGRYAEGTGSVLQQSGDVDEAYQEFRLCPEDEEDKRIEALEKLRLRYFTPSEVARLMGFPEVFSFPDETSVMQRYRALGNSLNVDVVSHLLKRELLPFCTR